MLGARRARPFREAPTCNKHACRLSYAAGLFGSVASAPPCPRIDAIPLHSALASVPLALDCMDVSVCCLRAVSTKLGVEVLVSLILQHGEGGRVLVRVDAGGPRLFEPLYLNGAAT